jgi:beta-phosphoglucomutase-like phosphatase (HAD superfamily)
MPDTRAIFFWMGGVLTQSIEPLMQAALAACGQPEVNLFSARGFASVCESLALGQLDDLAFCQAVCEMSGAKRSPEEFGNAVIASFSPVPRVIQTIERLPDTIQRWLIIDYPRSWFDQTRQRLSIHPCFHNEHLLFLQDSQLNRLVPDVFDFLAQQAKFRVDQCLVVDSNSHRAVAALDHGFPAAIFVDSVRLEREFVLRQFTARIPLEHRPATVIQGLNR